MSVTYEDTLTASRMLSSSISDQRQQISQIAKTYRQAAQLFLTRRLPEAYSTIEPVITPEEAEKTDGEPESRRSSNAPIALASRGTRIKVWSFYLTFLNSVIELGPEEGKHAFGSTRWRALVAKCRDGTIWEEVVQAGYGGVEGSVDADVVVNLATLLLTHSPSQRLTQQRLETYLSASSQPTFDITSHMNSPLYLQKRPGLRSNGTNTPRDLNSRLKLLELYTLHVLPRNGEWEYAREFISMSEVLDDERKEAFHLALHGLKEEQENAEIREEELRRQQHEQNEERRREAEIRRQEAAKAEDDRRRREQEEAESRRYRRTPNPAVRPSTPPANPRGPGASAASSRSSRPPKKSSDRPQTLYSRTASLFTFLQTLIRNTAHSMTANPTVFLRTLLSILAFALAFGRRDLRERIKRILAAAWLKIRRTVGMGTKISYI